MIPAFNKSGQFDRTYKLCFESIDLAADRVQKFLSYIKVEKNTLLRVRLSVEDNNTKNIFK